MSHETQAAELRQQFEQILTELPAGAIDELRTAMQDIWEFWRTQPDIDLAAEMALLFHFGGAESEFRGFRGGYDSDFSERLVRFITKYGNPAVAALHQQIDQSTDSPTVVEEAVKHIGHMLDEVTRAARLKLLIDCLHHPHHYVRDAATTGLAAIEDPAAIPALWAAVEREPIEGLKSEMRQVAEMLDEVKRRKE
jgi:hypothetical protein